ncbi:ATP-binding protein [Exilibacterium tricleocarpae]|nr:ATP-binding protein [Exilibacterium tricleocarpae]
MAISHQTRIKTIVFTWLSIASLIPGIILCVSFLAGSWGRSAESYIVYLYPLLLAVAVFSTGYLFLCLLKSEIVKYFFGLIRDCGGAENYELFLPKSIDQILPAVVFHINSLEQEKYRLSDEIERQKNEYRSILDSQAEIIFIISEDGFISYRNISFTLFFDDFGRQRDADSLCDISGKISDLLQDLEAFLAEARTTGAKQECTTTVFFDGKKRFVGWKIQPMQEYRPVRFLLVGRDETENMIIREKNLRLERIAVIGKAASAIFHEVNQPMSVMQISASLIEDLCRNFPEQEQGANTDEILANTKIIIDQIERTNQIIRNLRLLHSPEHQKIQTELFNPNQVMYRVHQYLAQELSGNNISFSYATKSPNAIIDGNTVLFSQVIVNIVQNSIHSLASDPDQTDRQIAVLSEVVGDQYMIIITDNGQGIPEADLARVMEPFFTTKPPDIGSGIGLSLCQDIVTKMNGKLGMSNIEPHGLKTVIVVPLPGA